MARTQAQEKGDALEKAVQLIETYILGSNPGTRDAIVTIEPKKIVVVNKVKHEIDMYIAIDYGKGYKALFIFECKNWKKKVDKDEIIVFSKKIEVIHAQKGYFVAKSFTRDAEAQAEQDGRIELLVATEELEALPSFIAGFHVLTNFIVDSFINLYFHRDEVTRIERVTNESFVQYHDEDLLLGKLRERLSDALVNEFMNTVPPHALSDGPYGYTREKSLVFRPRELIVEGHECIQADMKVTWETRLVRPVVVSQFDIKTRGRVITYESGAIPVLGNIQMSFIQIDQEGRG